MNRLALLVLLLVPSVASADSEKTVHWKTGQVFPAAVRFLRIDEDAKIIDKDADSGYVVFELPDDGKTYRGSLEVVAVSEDPVDTKIVIKLEDRPSYMESLMLDKLEQKLKNELGSK
jgi:hypothetical protein